MLKLMFSYFSSKIKTLEMSNDGHFNKLKNKFDMYAKYIEKNPTKLGSIEKEDFDNLVLLWATCVPNTDFTDNFLLLKSYHTNITKKCGHRKLWAAYLIAYAQQLKEDSKFGHTVDSYAVRSASCNLHFDAKLSTYPNSVRIKET
jgi:hypothetical protein